MSGLDDTIIALSSGQGRSGIAVFRISGPQANSFLTTYTKGALPEDRRASLRWVLDEEGERIDGALILRFEAPKSFTGEDLVELHTHGSLAVIDEILRLALKLDSFRLAEPGEFSSRAFENNKLDLVQAEGIADTIDATTPTQLRQAARFVSGNASGEIASWRKTLLEASAYLAASIDFSDEGDVGDAPHAPVLGLIENLSNDLQNALENSKRASRIRDGIHIAIVGEPNVGKSTLLNALIGKEAAIVSDIAGTTRDIIETPFVLNDVPVVLADTAGIRETNDPIEREGVKRATAWAERADLTLYLSPAYRHDSNPDLHIDLKIGTKLDQGVKDGDRFDILVSAKTGEGVSDLHELLTEKVIELTKTSEPPSLVRVRHQEQITKAHSALNRAKDLLEQSDDVDLAAFELSEARSALDRILGHIDTEDILGEVFSGFCVGK